MSLAYKYNFQVSGTPTQGAGRFIAYDMVPVDEVKSCFIITNSEWPNKSFNFSRFSKTNIPV
jgi:hypothetical protein